MDGLDIMMTDDNSRGAEAMARVLAIPELFEAILSQCGMQTLLVTAQRVCQHWKNFIASSPKLQNDLFFRPISNFSTDSKSDKGTTPVANPLLEKHFGKCFFDPEGVYDAQCQDDEYEGPDRFDRWGIFHHASAFQGIPWSGGRYGPPRQLGDLENKLYLCNINPSKDAQESRERFTRHGASWRRMLVSQPTPARLACVRVTEVTEGDEPSPESGLAIISPEPVHVDLGNGVRMGQLYDVVQQHVGHPGPDDSATFRVTWKVPARLCRARLVHELVAQMLERTGLVLELYSKNEDSAPQEPLYQEIFDEVFRCQDHPVYDMTPLEAWHPEPVELWSSNTWFLHQETVLTSWYGAAYQGPEEAPDWWAWKIETRSFSRPSLSDEERDESSRTMPVLFGPASLLKTPADVKLCCRLLWLPRRGRGYTTPPDGHPREDIPGGSRGEEVDFCLVNPQSWEDLQKHTSGEKVEIWSGNESAMAWHATGFNNVRF